MDPAKLRAWVSEQIEQHGPAHGRTPETAARLAMAAVALRGDRNREQIFGLQLPPEGVADAAPLYDRCVELLRAWETALDEASRTELAEIGHVLGIPLATSWSPPTWTTTHILDVFTAVEIDDYESPTGLVYDSPDVLEKFDNVWPLDDPNFADVLCLREASGGTILQDINHPNYGWAHDGDVHLAFDPTTQKLRAHYVFELSREPSPAELERFLRAFRDEFPDSGARNNLEWDRPAEPETACVHLGREIESYRIRLG
jgi:hypothetical protein